MRGGREEGGAGWEGRGRGGKREVRSGREEGGAGWGGKREVRGWGERDKSDNLAPMGCAPYGMEIVGSHTVLLA